MTSIFRDNSRRRSIDKLCCGSVHVCVVGIVTGCEPSDLPNRTQSAAVYAVSWLRERYVTAG
jgi:hypothetical protein